jgi:hypothetical protein
MKLFNKTIDRQLFKQYELGSDFSKQEAVVKIFNPFGNGTWFVLNSDPNDPDYLWAIVDLGYGAEVGSVSRADLETYRGRFGMGFERDLSFDPVNAEELYKGLRAGKFYAEGGKIAQGSKYGDWAITQYVPLEYGNLGEISGGLIKLVNQDTMEDLVIRNDNALRGNAWFISYKGARIEDKNPNVVIEKLLKKANREMADGGGLKDKIEVKNFADLKQGDVVRRKDKLGTTIFVIVKSPVQSRSYKNEYDALATCIVSNTDYYKPFEEYHITSVIKNGKLGNVDYIGKWNYDDAVDYSVYLPKSNKKFGHGGEVSFIDYKDNLIMFEPHFDKYYANDVEFDSLQEAKDFLDSGEIDPRIRDAYARGLFEDGGKIEVVYERRADFKKKPIKLLLLNKGKEQKGYTFSGKDQVAVLENYNRNKQEDLEKLWNLKGYESKYADGGDIENFSDNQRMIMNQNVEVEHHHEELEDILEDEIEVPAWVVAKMETATQNLSDITHYLDGEKDLKEEQEEEYGEFDYSNLDDDDDEIKNKEVVEPINVSAGTKAEITKKFTDNAMGNLRGFLKGMEGIDLRDDYTFDYKDEQFEIEPIINSDENGVSNAVFTIFDGDGEEQGEVTYSRDGGKQKFTANSELFGWNNAKFEDGGYFDGTIPKVSTYMTNYAKGGEIAKAEILGLKRNIMGTTDIEMKISGMRKPQSFIVYPIGADDAGNVITIQSDTRIGQINLVKGVGVMSQSHSNGAYFVHLQIDGMTSFAISESDLEKIKSHIFKTAGDNVGSRGIVSDNSGASRIFAEGGGIGFIPMALEEDLRITAKWGGTDIKGVVGILNAMIDSGLTDEDLKPAPTKTGTQYEKAKDKKTREIWTKIEPNYKGDLMGNMYYGTIHRLVDRANTPDQILKRFKPFRNLQKDSFADGGSFEDYDGIAYAKTNAKRGMDWDKELREYAGSDYSKLTEREKEAIISDLMRDWDRSNSFADGGNFDKPFNVLYKTKSGTTMVAKRIMAKDEKEAERKLEKQMRASSSFDKVVMSHPSFENGGFMNNVYAKGGTTLNDASEYEGYNLKDINGKKIEVGDTVKTTQPSGGLLNPADSETGVVEKTKDAFGQDSLQIRYRKQGTNYDRFILLNGKINEIISKSNSSSKEKKYILKADIKTVTVKRNGKEVTYKGADVLNGANVLSDGGDISSKANYIPKRDIVEVELKDGSTVNPVNGYWVKKGAEPIGTDPTPSSSGKSETKINTTEIRKDPRGNWRAETFIENFNDYDWKITTIKTYSGQLLTSAQGGKTMDSGSKGISMFKYAMYEDPHHTLEVSKPKRLTEKVVSEQHEKGLAKFKKFMETGMFKGGGKISNFDKLSAKVAKQYKGKAVKNPYQEEYGKYYSKEEAQEVGDKVAGKVKAMQGDSKAFGGFFSSAKDLMKPSVKYPNLRTKQVQLKSGRYVQVFNQNGNKLDVIFLGDIGRNVKPHTIDIEEVDLTTMRMGGEVEERKPTAGSELMKKANVLAKEIRKDGESWLDARKRAFAQLKK